MKKIIKNLFRITPFKITLSITLIFLAISMIYDINPKLVSIVSTIADKSLDYKFKLRGPEKSKSKIVIVAGDEKSFQAFGQWPFDRATVFAPLLDTLCKFQSKAVGLDIVWSEAEKTVSRNVRQALNGAMGPKADSLDEILSAASGDGALHKAIENCGSKLVLGYALDTIERDAISKKEFSSRVKTLTESGQNTALTRMKGEIRFPSYRQAPDGNVSFHYVGRSGLLNSPTLVPPKTAQGFFNNDNEDDGNYRRAIFFYRVEDKFVSSLALRMAQKAFGTSDTPPSVFIEPDAPEQNLSQELQFEFSAPQGKHKIPVDLYGQAIVNFRGPNMTYPNVSMADVLSPSESIEYEQYEPGIGVKKYQIHKSELFKDALVLVGITAQALYDIRPRPFDPQAAGVENHANILDNLVNDDFLARPTTEMLAIMLASILVGSLLFGWVVGKLDAKLGAVFAALWIGALLYFDQVYLFNNRGVVFSGQLQAIQFLFQYLGITVLKYMQEESEKKFIRSAFGKYVSPTVVNSMLSDPSKLKLGGDKKELSIMFSDIAGFTELSERVDVKVLTQFLNEYLGAMTDILQANGGTLDKYIGDAVMGFWGAPLDIQSHASLAVKTAIEMQLKVDELNAQFKQKYDLTIGVRIGINSGPVSVGNFGSSKVFSYTVIGDNVNLASRLEAINKYYGTSIMISENTHALLKSGEFLCREVDMVKVKGKHKPVKIYEVFPDNASHQPLKTVLSSFNDGLKSYYGRRWEEAMTFFRSVLKTCDGDQPALQMIERCQYYLSNPPGEDWDGSWEMKSK